MSYDVKGGTKAQCELLRANGFRESPFESILSGESDGNLFHGHWIHPEMPKGVAHMSTADALEWLLKRQEKLRAEPSIGHTTSDFRGQRGASLFEVLFVIVFVLILGGIFFGGCMELTGVPQNLRRENAQKQAYNWLHEFRQDLQNPRVSCMGVDTDRNGYVTCQVGDGRSTTVQIECRSCAWICAGVGPSDCREYRVFTPQFISQGQQ